MNDDLDEEIVKLSASLGQQLKQRGLLLATAESCTGGGVARAVTEVAGSSEWFDRGFVTYSNAAKAAMLGVPPSLIDSHGAVSEQVAAAMAEGAARNSDATVAVSTTGIAGPGGAVPGKPVGTVCFGYRIGDRTKTERMQFDGDRHGIREQSVAHALRTLSRLLGAA